MTDFFSPKDIQKLLDAEDKAIEAFVAKLKNKIERQLNQVAKTLDKEKNLLKITTELNKLSRFRFPKQVQAELDKYIGLFQKNLADVKDAIQTTNNIEKVFSDKDQRIVNQLFDFSKVRLVTTIEQTYNEFKAVAYQRIISSDLPDLSTVTQSVTNNLESRLPSEINTQLAAFQRSVTLQKAKDLELTHFLYAGGLIKTSREFCQERAGEIYRFEDTKSWDNGQGLPVIPYLGGWNCRHIIVPMPESKAIELGYGS